MSYQETLGGIGQQFDTEKSDLETRLASALSDDVSDDEQIAALQAEVSRLAAENSTLTTTNLEQKQIIARKTARIQALRAERDQLKIDLANCQGTTLKK